MAAGEVQLYNSAYATIFQGTAGAIDRIWDDNATAGNIMWMLAASGYTPADTHATTTDVTNQVVTGDAVPIDATNLLITQSTATTYFEAGANASAGVVSFAAGAATITAKYLICIMPVTASTFSGTTDELIFYVDLNDGGSDLTSTAGDFIINMPTNGWFSINQV